MDNKKTFLYEKDKVLFIVAIVADKDGAIKAKSVGKNVFCSNGFIECDSANAVTYWLKNSGYTYIKRLPVIKGSEYNERKIIDLLRSYRKKQRDSLSENNKDSLKCMPNFEPEIFKRVIGVLA